MTTRVFLQGLFMLALGAFIFSPSCTKVQHSGQWPQLLGPNQVDSAYWTAARLEQVAKQKADSMNIVDSLARANGSVDTNSLVNKKNIMVAYVEVNNFTIENAGCYVDENGKNIFDLCYIFAPNINLDNTTGKPTIQYNSQVAAMLNNGAVRATQAKGLKVGMSILGNHDDAGFRNFRNLGEATAFAQIVAAAVRRYGLDAIDFDDEYSNSPAWANDSSMVMVVSEVKRLLPDKLVTVYVFDGAVTANWNGKMVGDYADIGYTPFYPELPTAGMGGFPASKLCGSTSPTGGGFGDVAGAMNTIKSGGFKGMQFYNVTGASTEAAFIAPYLSSLKGKTLSVLPNCLQ
jgi:hypothetical protein